MEPRLIRFDAPEEDEASNGLVPLSPTFFYLSTGHSVVGIPFQEFQDSYIVGFTYKVDLVKDKNNELSTRFRRFYPSPLITLYKNSIVYQSSPLPAIEYRWIATVLFERRRELELIMTQLDLFPYEQVEMTIDELKRRKIAIESASFK